MKNIKWEKVNNINTKLVVPNRGYDMTNKTYGKLKVIGYNGNDNRGERMWLCKCDCGTEVVRNGYGLRSGRTTHCGCDTGNRISKSLTQHGMTNSKLYYTWVNMKTRCENPNYYLRDSYGGKGITYCDDWKDSSKFIKWAIENGYSDELSLDRINNDGNYEPSNCRWVSMQVQQNNRTNNRIEEYNGVKDTLANWSRKLNIEYAKLQYKLDCGYTMGEIIGDK